MLKRFAAAIVIALAVVGVWGVAPVSAASCTPYANTPYLSGSNVVASGSAYCSTTETIKVVVQLKINGTVIASNTKTCSNTQQCSTTASGANRVGDQPWCSYVYMYINGVPSGSDSACESEAW